VRSALVILLATVMIGPDPTTRVTTDQDTEAVVMVAPSVNDDYYAPVFEQVIDYDVTVVNTIREHTNVVLVVDRATLPYVDGRIPDEHLLVRSVFDIWARDFSPVTGNRAAKFRFQPDYLSPQLGNQIDRSFNRLTDAVGAEFPSTRLRLDGGNFVGNGGNWAIVTERVFSDNPNKSEAWIDRKIRRKTQVTSVAYIPEEPGDTTGHADGMVMWLDADTLLVNEFDEPFRSQVLDPIVEAFAGVEIIEIPVD
jgi:agmatine/peptidylarginine deiminase